MSLYIDLAFAARLIATLDKGKQTRSNLFIARCPVCGDSQKKANKRRLYIYQNLKGSGDHMSVDCKNCGYASSFYKFLEKVDPILFQEYKMELFKENRGDGNYDQYQPKTESQERIQTTAEIVTESVLDNVWTISQLPDDHHAKIYVRKRGIPVEFESYLLYSMNFRESVIRFCDADDFLTLPEDERLIIPFYDEYKRLRIVQGRSFDPFSQLRYITVKNDPTANKVFGLDRVIKNKTVLVVEGPIDSLFLPNAIATADANLLSAGIGDIFIPDNQPRNKEVCSNIEKIFDAGKCVVLFPKHIQSKDINEFLLNEGSKRDLFQIIAENRYQGLRGKLAFSKWKQY